METKNYSTKPVIEMLTPKLIKFSFIFLFLIIILISFVFLFQFDSNKKQIQIEKKQTVEEKPIKRQNIKNNVSELDGLWIHQKTFFISAQRIYLHEREDTIKYIYMSNMKMKAFHTNGKLYLGDSIVIDTKNINGFAEVDSLGHRRKKNIIGYRQLKPYKNMEYCRDKYSFFYLETKNKDSLTVYDNYDSPNKADYLTHIYVKADSLSVVNFLALVRNTKN